MPVVDLTIDSSGATKGLKQYDTSVDKAGKTTDTLNKKLKAVKGNMALMATAAAAAATAGMGVFVKEAIAAASAMEETQSKFDTVFRGMTEEAEGWASNLSQNFGMAREESKRYLSSVQDLLVPMGMARDAAGQMSNEVVQLAADLGSFNNMDTATVMAAIQSALVGNYETMKTYGIVINETLVKEEALNLGLWDGVGALDANAKAQAAYSLMVKGSTDAIGDFNRTQEGFANQMKIAKAHISDMLAELGQRLLPIVTKAVAAFNKWAEDTDNVNGVIKIFITTLQAIYNASQVVETVWRSLAVIATGLGTAFYNIMRPLELILEGFAKLGLIDSNPLKEYRETMEGMFESSLEGMTKHIEGWTETNVAMNEARDGIGEVTEATQKATAAVVEETTATTEGAATFTELEAMAKQAQEIVTASTGTATEALQGEKVAVDQVTASVSAKNTATAQAAVVEQTWAEKMGGTERVVQGAASSTQQLTSALTANTTATSAAVSKQMELHTATKQQVQVQTEMSNSFTSSGDAALDLAAKLQTLRELSEMTAASNENIFGDIGGAWSAFTQADLTGANANLSGAAGGSGSVGSVGSNGVSQESQLISDFVSSGGSILDLYGSNSGTTVNINQSVSRSDVSNIMSEGTRIAERQ